MREKGVAHGKNSTNGEYIRNNCFSIKQGTRLDSRICTVIGVTGVISTMPGRKRKIAEVDTDNSDIEIAEERVLSHAAQRRLRKRQNTIAATKEEAASSKPPDNTKQTTAHSIWVGNIAFRTTPQALKSFFGGELSEITRIHMPAKKLHGTRIKSEQKRGDNKGYV